MGNKPVVVEMELASGSITKCAFSTFKVAIEVLYSIRDSEVVRNIKIMSVEGD